MININVKLDNLYAITLLATRWDQRNKREIEEEQHKQSRRNQRNVLEQSKVVTTCWIICLIIPSLLAHSAYIIAAKCYALLGRCRALSFTHSHDGPLGWSHFFLLLMGLGIHHMVTQNKNFNTHEHGNPFTLNRNC
jgi:hypothetical protein